MSFILLILLLTGFADFTNGINIAAPNRKLGRKTNLKVVDLKEVEKNLIEDLKGVLQDVSLKTTRLYNIMGQKALKQCPPQWTKLDDLCYYLQPYWKTTWSGAQSSCLKLNANLVVMDSEEKMGSFIAFLTDETLGRASTSIWIGGFEYLYKGTWFWINGSPLNMTSDSVPPDEIEFDVTWPRRCLTWNTSNETASVSCEDILPFVCVRGSM